LLIPYKITPVYFKICTYGILLLFTAFAQAQDFGTGLLPADPEKLARMPKAPMPFSGSELPRSVDLSDKMPPPGQQGKQNSCVAWSIAYGVKSYQEKLEEGNSYFSGGYLNYDAVFSPAYIYNQANGERDGGLLFEVALNLLRDQGAPKMSVMGYNEQDYLTRPTPFQKEQAKKYRIAEWDAVDLNNPNLKERIFNVKTMLNAGLPVIFGATVDEGFNADGMAGVRPFIWSVSKGNIAGRHAMVAVGYDDDLGAFKVLNSYGAEWGNNGYLWITYDHFVQVVNEAYIARDALNPPERPDAAPPQETVDVPGPAMMAGFTLDDVQHNLQSPVWGPGMTFVGKVQIPAGMGTSAQIVVRFYYDNGFQGKGVPVGSLSVNFSYPDGTAVTSSGAFAVPYNGGFFQWQADMPYNVLNITRGYYDYLGQYVPWLTNLVAEPVLFVDNYPVLIGQPVAFWVSL
jgi:hypothetical protein